jgi:protein arginine kinase activator
LDSVLKTMHKDIRHRGKVPAGIQSTLKGAHRLQSLNRDLQVAIAQEDFESAARLRDEIKAFKAAE